MNDWQGQFAQGFQSTGEVNNGFIVVLFLLLVAAMVGLWFLYNWYQKYQAKRPRMVQDDKAPRVGPKYVPIRGRANPLQQKIIQDLIDEFRKQETSAQAVPSAILEKYSEFFFNNVSRLKTSDKDVEEFLNRNYPLEEGFNVELDFHTSGALHLIKSNVIEIIGKSIIVEFTGPIPDFLKKGMNLQLNYSAGKHFLQGSTTITDIRHDLGLVLKKPTEVVLTSERRYNRLVLKKASGTLHEPRTDHHSPVKVLDISLEGVRVQVGRPLDKTRIYQLTFESQTEGGSVMFGPIECAPSKDFLTGAGTFETGLVFLYLDMGTKARLLQYMKHLVQELQAAAKAAAPAPAETEAEPATPVKKPVK